MCRTLPYKYACLFIDANDMKRPKALNYRLDGPMHNALPKKQREIDMIHSASILFLVEIPFHLCSN